jgi:hypothetical protein
LINNILEYLRTLQNGLTMNKNWKNTKLSEAEQNAQIHHSVAQGDVTELIQPLFDGSVTELIKPLSDDGVTEFIKPLFDGSVTEFIKPLSDGGVTELIKPLSDGGVTELIESLPNKGAIESVKPPVSNKEIIQPVQPFPSYNPVMPPLIVPDHNITQVIRTQKNADILPQPQELRHKVDEHNDSIPIFMKWFLGFAVFILLLNLIYCLLK